MSVSAMDSFMPLYPAARLPAFQQFHVVRSLIEGVFGVRPGITETRIFQKHVEELLKCERRKHLYRIAQWEREYEQRRATQLEDE